MNANRPVRERSVKQRQMHMPKGIMEHPNSNTVHERSHNLKADNLNVAQKPERRAIIVAKSPQYQHTS